MLVLKSILSVPTNKTTSKKSIQFMSQAIFKRRNKLCYHSCTDLPAKLLQAGKFNKTNIIAGVAQDDGSIFVTGAPGGYSDLLKLSYHILILHLVFRITFFLAAPVTKEVEKGMFISKNLFMKAQ